MRIHTNAVGTLEFILRVDDDETVELYVDNRLTGITTNEVRPEDLTQALEGILKALRDGP